MPTATRNIAAGRLRFNAVLVAFAATVLAMAPAAVAQTVGGVSAKQPVIVHVPVVKAGYGQTIQIKATTSCTVPTCTAALYFRPTDPNGQFFSGVGWTRVDLQRGETTFVPETGRTLVEWSGTIPAAVVMARGVDYLIEANDAGWVQRAPAYDGSSGDFFYHVVTVAPPLPAHAPPPFAPADRELPVEVEATCGRSTCEATLHYRTSTGPVTETDPRQWPSTSMTLIDSQPVGEGVRARFRGTIPAGYVDTRGVDYAIHITDGELNGWSPGTTYQPAYFAAADGAPTAYHHVHVLESPHIAHVPVTTARYREEISVRATANCPSTRTCTANLYFRTTTSGLTDEEEPQFQSIPMLIERRGSAEGTDTVELSANIPAAVVDTRGVDYFFSVSDGPTTTWWPGMSRVDGYVPVEGTPVGWQHVRVTEPPHILPALDPVARQGEAHTVTARVSCSTPTCAAVLHYTVGTAPALGSTRTYEALPMTAVERAPTPFGELITYTATITAERVTSEGIAYYVEATDGYTKTYSPGTSYWGAYAPADGDRAGGDIAFPVLTVPGTLLEGG